MVNPIKISSMVAFRIELWAVCRISCRFQLTVLGHILVGLSGTWSV